MSSKGGSLFIRFRSLMRSTWKKQKNEKNNNKIERQWHKSFMAICRGHSHSHTHTIAYQHPVNFNKNEWK